ncbi:NADP-dependent phosphogluconate dehydrogenase [Jiella sp. MQZ9-1]|uniref:6-phosphogluconate dehydrogenase, decarboxylating n=1 Tax=Jiella flava TaxID=2816857 RepID=A0A939JVF4_9HYPH|nr:NADP-dependent phosphogluconate dehydrogenase [Jiella flava]MBO0664160.1 NADP-dependent phosphogluconate dehydrogenase [Jiella flava]MCD2472732.1 NADP-dependent phosphogluconate dehydrogenase [Jiella flava]
MADGQADIGVIGMGTMGANLALNIAEKGFKVAVQNRTPAKAFALKDDNPELADNILPAETLEDFVKSLNTPRRVIFMVPAGQPVDDEMDKIRPLLEDGDVMIDAGNADFNDTVRRAKTVEGTGLKFIGMGVSGGELGARHGPSIMVGGDKDTYPLVEPVLTKIAARFHDAPCVAWLGTDGAGHFVKTIHNGIEYADMQMIAEIYGVMRDGLKLEPAKMAAIFRDWNSRELSSYLIEITAVNLDETDPQTGKPMVEVIIDEAGQKGTGRWAVIEAQKLGVGATTLEAAVAARGLSSRREEREHAAGLYAGVEAGQSQFFADEAGFSELESALVTAKIIAYAQGYAAMAAASDENGWDLPLGTIAEIWRAGCIIRSHFLDDIAKAYDKGQKVVNILQAPDFVGRVAKGQSALRRVVAKAALAGIPVPALSAALAYFDDYRRARGTANLTQAQRDLFGAHTFRRFDADGAVHHKWPAV